MRVVVGRVGRAHGLHGDVAVVLRTDEPELRFQIGAVVYPSLAPSRPGSYPATLEVIARRWHSGRLLVRFAQCPDRSAVEVLAGVTLEAEVDVTAPGDDPEEYHDLALIGLAAVQPDGSQVGHVVAVLHLPGQDVLEIGRPGHGGEAVLVPFVRALVPSVDLSRCRVVVDLPPGLVDQSGSADQSHADQLSSGHDGIQLESLQEGCGHGGSESPDDAG